MLTLPEELMLLALDDNTGMVAQNAQGPLKMGLVSAALTELTLTGKLRVDGYGNVIAVNAAPTGDDLLDDILSRIGRAQPPRPTHAWLQHLTNDLRDVEGRVRTRLVQRGVLRQEESRKFFIIREVRFPTQNPGFEANVRSRLRDVVINNAQPDERTMALIGLVKLTNLVETAFPYTEWQQARQRIDQLTNPQFAGWQYQAQPGAYGYEQQAMPMSAGGMMAGFVPSLMFSMMAQSMFWGMGGWMMPGMMMGGMGGMGGFGAAPEDGMPMDESQMSEVNAEDGGFDGGFDFGGDFGGEF